MHPPKKNVTGFLDSISGISSSAKSGKLFILRNFFNYLYDHHFTVRTNNDPVCHSKPSEEVKAEPEKIDFSNVKIEPLFEEEVDFDTFSKSDFRAVKVKECVAVPKSKKLLRFTLDDGTGTDRTILSGIHAYYEPEELVGKTLIAITNLPPRKMMGIESCGMLLSAVNNLKDSEDEELHLLMVDNHIPAGAKLY